ncbi:zincin [Marasmius fiardii PR-910]|nr:zincin [Marasmius fiardii PR-910]
MVLAKAFIILAVSYGVAAAAFDKRAHVVSCANPTKNALITQEFANAENMASLASQYIAQNGADPLFVSYFMTNTPAAVKANYDKIVSDVGSADIYCQPFPAGRNVDCTGLNALTRTPSGNIYLCPPWYNLADQSALCTQSGLASTRSGTIVHEMSHAEAGTHDYNGSCSGSKGLSPADALENATTYSCFAREVYKATQC